MPSSSPVKLAYPLKQAAEVLGLSVRSLRYLIAAGRLGCVRLGRRVLIRHADIEVLLRRHYVKPVIPLDVAAPIRPGAGERTRDGEAGR
jgi:excisionase family DNA binding protein